MSAAYLVDGQAVYAPASGRPGGVLHRAVLLGRCPAPQAGCGAVGRLDEDGLLFADEVGTARVCVRAGCGGTPWNRGCGARQAQQFPGI